MIEFIAVTFVNLVTPKGAAKLELKPIQDHNMQSLLLKTLNYNCKSLYTIGPGLTDTSRKIFTLVYLTKEC